MRKKRRKGQKAEAEAEAERGFFPNDANAAQQKATQRVPRLSSFAPDTSRPTFKPSRAPTYRWFLSFYLLSPQISPPGISSSLGLSLAAVQHLFFFFLSLFLCPQSHASVSYHLAHITAVNSVSPKCPVQPVCKTKPSVFLLISPRMPSLTLRSIDLSAHHLRSSLSLSRNLRTFKRCIFRKLRGRRIEWLLQSVSLPSGLQSSSLDRLLASLIVYQYLARQGKGTVRCIGTGDLRMSSSPRWTPQS